MDVQAQRRPILPGAEVAWSLKWPEASRHAAVKQRCPVYPRKQTSIGAFSMSALGQTATYALQQSRQSFDHLIRAGEQRRG
jgi:hypothetical protein